MRSSTSVSALAAEKAPASNEASTSVAGEEKRNQPNVVIAGGGIGGLCLALALQAKGIPFTLYEKVKKYKPFGGPIQLQCNALAALEAIDMKVANEILDLGTITGDRVNGLLDGKTGEWYVRFDTRKPAKKDGLPLTLVLNRYVLLDILKNAINPSNINLGKRVVSYTEQVDQKGRKEVEVHFDDGTSTTGDVVIAADGINSSVRKQMDPKVQDATYSGYTCYTATCDFELEDIEEIGYQVYLGYGQYFVASDVGGGQTQWYAFRKQDAGNPDTSNNVRQNLLDMFEGWDEHVLARLVATKEEEIEQRDIYDRKPVLSWVKGNAALIGDSAHAMQPNMGQGGCQAIEDAYVLADQLSRCNTSILASSSNARGGGEEEEEGISIDQALKNYERKRCMRAAAIHGFARSAALMTTTWRPYIGSDPYDFYKYIPGAMAFWAFMEKLKIPHPGKIAGQIAMMSTIDMILEYIACGNPVEEKDRVAYCQVPGIGVPKRNIPKNAFDMKGIPGFAK